MSKLSKNEAGFSAVEAVLIIVVIVVIGVAGWLAYNSHHKKTTTTSSTKLTTASSAATKTATTTNPYTGWKSYCDSATKGCFKYPGDWGNVSAEAAQGIKATVQNKAETVDIDYAEPVKGTGGEGNYVDVSLDSLTVSDNLYKIVGGYYTDGNIPGYNLVDTSRAESYGLGAGVTTSIDDTSGLIFTSESNKASLSVHYNNTSGASSISAATADKWFSSADGKTALLIVKSYYLKD